MQGDAFYESQIFVDPVAHNFEIIQIWTVYGPNLAFTWSF